jgi:hypothetical protein
VRLLFAPEERHRVSARYHWPVPRGFANLVRVRRRWCEGNVQLRRTFPTLPPRTPRRARALAGYICLALAAPVSTAVFAAIYAIGRASAVALPRSTAVAWRRGR